MNSPIRLSTVALNLLAVAVPNLAHAQAVQAHWPLLTDLRDVTGNYSAATLSGSPTPTPPSNGVCLTPSQKVGTPSVRTLNVNDFQLDFEFTVDALPPTSMGAPILSASSTRFMGLYLRQNGTFGILYNNTGRSWTNMRVSLNRWYYATIKYESGTVQLHLDGCLVHEATIGALTGSAIYAFETFHGSNGTYHNGCFRNLRVSNDTNLGPASSYVMAQNAGGTSFGNQATGQTFKPGFGVFPTAGAATSLPLHEFSIWQGSSGALSPSAMTYLNIYDGDPNAGGNFVGSSTNFVDTNAPELNRLMQWSFPDLELSTTTEYWAILSSTDTAGGLDVTCSMNAAGNDYAGGSGLQAGIVLQPQSRDLRFEARFTFASTTGRFATFGAGCAGTDGIPTLSSSTPPSIGETFTVDCADLPQTATTAFAVLGFNRKTPAIDLGAIGMTDCSLYIELDFPTTQPVTAGTASLAVTLPNDTAMVGHSLFYQWFASDAAANPLGLISSDAGEAVIGC